MSALDTDTAGVQSRVINATAAALQVTPQDLVRAAQLSVAREGDKGKCPSADLMLLWLAKPVLVGHAMDHFPDQTRFAWVDAGFNEYRAHHHKTDKFQ